MTFNKSCQQNVSSLLRIHMLTMISNMSTAEVVQPEEAVVAQEAANRAPTGAGCGLRRLQSSCSTSLSANRLTKFVRGFSPDFHTYPPHICHNLNMPQRHIFCNTSTIHERKTADPCS